MKEFAFPISVKFDSVDDKKMCSQMLTDIGYKSDDFWNACRDGIDYEYIILSEDVNGRYEYHNHNGCKEKLYHVDHFNPDLIRDIASVCKNPRWQMDEPKVRASGEYIGITGDNSLCRSHFEVSTCTIFRPTIEEICDYHGYYIDGKDIIKKDRVKNSSDTYANNDNIEKALANLESAAIETLIVSYLREQEKKTGCKYSLTKTESVETKLL